jgi:mycothiol synthase
VPHPLADGYTIGPAHIDRAEDIHALIVASDIADWGEASGYSLDEVRDELADIDPERDAWIVTSPASDVVGFASIRDRQHIRMDVEGYVHPEHRERGIGTTLVQVSEDRARDHVALAREGSRVIIQNWINAQNPDACALLERRGYEPFRYFNRMEMSLDGNLPGPEWPKNVKVLTCESEDAQQGMYAMMEEAMADHWGHIPRTFEEWMRHRKGSTFDPSLWFLAINGESPAGGAVCSISDGVGWVDLLGVRGKWRRRGLGMALLRQAATTFDQRGIGRMALGVDSASPTGATRLYERAGMHVAQQHATYGKVLREGAEPGDTDHI